MTCNCAAAGWCETFKRVQSERNRQICRDEILTPEKTAIYRANWAMLAVRNGKRKTKADCLHRGDELRREKCSTCAGTVQVKIFACAVLGECTIAKPISGIHACEGCVRYQAGESVTASATGG